MSVAETSENLIVPKIFDKKANKAYILNAEKTISESLGSGEDIESCLNGIFLSNKNEINITHVLGLMLHVIHDKALTTTFGEKIENWDFPGPDRHDVKVQKEMMKKLWQATLLISEVGKKRGKLSLAKKKVSAAYNFVEGNNIGNIRQLGRSVFSRFAELVYDYVKVESKDTGQIEIDIDWDKVAKEPLNNDRIIP